MAVREPSVSGRAPADVVFIRRGSTYRAEPPSHKANPATKTNVTFRNLTGSQVLVWFPGSFLLGSPRPLGDADETFDISPEARAGAFPYAAYVVTANEFVEGNSPPEIIIDT
jgi:hypothetical protein